jgi:hypothetical protein
MVEFDYFWGQTASAKITPSKALATINAQMFIAFLFLELNWIRFNPDQENWT